MFFFFAQKIYIKKANIQAKNTWIYYKLQFFLINPNLLGFLNLSSLNLLDLNLILLYKIFIYKTHILF